jgi:hypothetical protein
MAAVRHRSASAHAAPLSTRRGNNSARRKGLREAQRLLIGSRLFGRFAAIGLLAFPTLAATWLIFAATLWGDLAAGLLLGIVTARAYRLAGDIYEREQISWRQVIILELLLVAMVYLRGNTIVAVGAIHVFLVSLVVVARDWSRLVPTAGMFAVGLLVFFALLAPWSITATKVLDSTVVTTSSAPLSLAS